MIALNRFDLELVIGFACLASVVNAYCIRAHLHRALVQRQLRRRWKGEAAAAAARAAEAEAAIEVVNERAARLASMLAHCQGERAQLEISLGIVRRQLGDAQRDWPAMVRARLQGGEAPVSDALPEPSPAAAATLGARGAPALVTGGSG